MRYILEYLSLLKFILLWQDRTHTEEPPTEETHKQVIIPDEYLLTLSDDSGNIIFRF